MTDSTDPRSTFRLPARNCGSCFWWCDRFGTPQDKKQPLSPIEAPCGHKEVCDTSKWSTAKTNYENGWRRASDLCHRWYSKRKMSEELC